MSSDDIWDSLDPDGYGPQWFDKAGNPITLREWGRLKYQSDDYYRIGHCLIMGADGPVEISTVWVGLDHRLGEGPPLIFETMVFGGPHDQEMERYSTEVAALAGHDRWVARESERVNRKSTEQ